MSDGPVGGRRGVNPDRPLVEEVVEIDAPRELVFDLLTSSRGLTEWIAVEAECEAQPGGVIRWRHENGAVASGRFLTIERPSRVVFSYGWEQGPLDVPPGSTRVEITLEERDARTVLRLVHHLLPSEMAEEHRQGWRWFLGRLAACCAGGTTPVDCPIEENEETKRTR